MVSWVWIILAFLIGSIFGYLIAAILVAGSKDHIND